MQINIAYLANKSHKKIQGNWLLINCFHYRHAIMKSTNVLLGKLTVIYQQYIISKREHLLTNSSNYN